MSSLPIEYGLILAGVLFTLGLVGVLVRRNLLVVVASLEIMLNAAGLVFVLGGARWGRADGQIMFLVILAVAAAEVAVGLALAIIYRRRLGRLDIDLARKMRG
jgi:NADH-quinone oxidoreductase subunit K